MDVKIKTDPGILIPEEKYLVAKCNYDNIRFYIDEKNANSNNL